MSATMRVSTLPDEIIQAEQRVQVCEKRLADAKEVTKLAREEFEEAVYRLRRSVRDQEPGLFVDPETGEVQD